MKRYNMYTLMIRIASLAVFLIVTSAVFASTAMAVSYGAKCLSSSLKAGLHEPGPAMRAKSSPCVDPANSPNLSKGAKA